MPRPKKQELRGIAKALKLKKENVESEQNLQNSRPVANKKNKSVLKESNASIPDAACGTQESSDKQPKFESKSAEKLSHVNVSLLDNISRKTTEQEEHGFVLVDTSVLCEYLNAFTVCEKCFGPISTKPDFKNSKGFAVPFVRYCAHCQTEATIFISSNKQSTPVKHSDTKDKSPDRFFHPSYEINLRMVTFIREIGKGHSALQTFSRTVNSTGITNTAYDGLLNKLCEASKQVAEKSMMDAADEVREEIGRNIMVSVDGSWQRRGHSSRNGLTTTAIVSTGKVVDVEIMTNYCKLCEQGKKDSEHTCKLNHTGSSGAMEGHGAVNIFNRSEASRDLRYTEYLGDGDTSAYLTVVDSKPYGDETVVSKQECIGHIQKRVGGRLRKLKSTYRGKKLSDGKTISGKGRLTDTIINRLQNYYGMAIRNNLNSVNEMQNNILASLYHVASRKEDPDHNMCPTGPDSWCKYQRDPESYVHKDGIPQPILELIEPIIDELSEAELLSKCMHGKTQNTNEAFHKLVWDRCLKEVWVGKLVLEQATYSAVAHFNDGSSALINILCQMGLVPGYFTQKNCVQADFNRLSSARRKSCDEVKQRRKDLRAMKKGFIDKNIEKEGESYSKGGF